MARRANPFKQFARILLRSTRPALERTFRFWLAERAPDHFDRAAFQQYPEAYNESAKRDKEKWLRARRRLAEKYLVDPKARPVVKSRRFRARFLRGTVLYTGSAKRLRVTWAGLPPYATYVNRYSGFQPAEAVTYVPDREEGELAAVFAENLMQISRSGEIPVKTHGFKTIRVR